MATNTQHDNLQGALARLRDSEAKLRGAERSVRYWRKRVNDLQFEREHERGRQPCLWEPTPQPEEVEVEGLAAPTGVAGDLSYEYSSR
jgi:hypothetical protein